MDKKQESDKIASLQAQTVKLIKQLSLADRSRKSAAFQFRMKTLSDINYNLHELLVISPQQIQPFTQEKLIVYIRYFFVQNGSKIPPLQYFRLILVSQEIALKLIQHNIPLYIARILERDDSKVKTNYDDEAFAALKLMANWIQKFPHTFPQFLAFSLIAFSELPVFMGYDEKKKDQISQYLKKYSLQIILNLSERNPRLCCMCGGFGILVSSIIDPFLHDKSYEIVCRMLYDLNQKGNRDLTTTYMDIRKLFHLFTNIDNTFVEDISKARGNLESMSKFQTRLKLAKNAIVTLLKSWTGLIFIGNDRITINSLLEALKQIPKRQDSDIRKYIFEILEEIISIGDNILTTTFQQNVFRVSNLIACYLMSLIELLIQNNLLKILIQLSGLEDSFVSEPAQRLLKKLTLLIFNFLPQSSKYIDFLISAATKNSGLTDIIKSSSSFVINKIGNYIYDRKVKVNHPLFNYMENLFSLKTIFVPFERTSVNSISKSLNFITYQEKEGHRKKLLQDGPILKDDKDDFLKWNWSLIEQLLMHPDVQKFKEKADNFERHKEGKIYKYLLRFYSPSRGSFTKQQWNVDNFQYVKVGMLVVKNVITIPENIHIVTKPAESQFECTVSLMGELEKLLEQNLNALYRDKYRLQFFKTMERELITWISLFSENRIGYETLLCENKFFEMIYEFISKEECSHLINIFMMNLDFYRQNMKKKKGEKEEVIIGPKALLQRCANQGSKPLKLGCLQIIKILFKAQIDNFSIFGYHIIITMLNDESQELKSNVVDFLDQHLAIAANIELFLKCIKEYKKEDNKKWSLLMKKLSNNILIRLISQQTGFNLIRQQSPQWLDKEYEKWVQSNKDGEGYCLKLQSILNSSLHFIDKNQKSYRMSENKNIYDMLFLYKLPLLLCLNEKQYPLWVKQSKNGYNLFVQFQKGQVRLDTDSIKIMLVIGTMLVDEEFNLTYEKNPFMIFLTINSKVVNLYGQQVNLVQNNGISIYYKNQGFQYEIRRVIINIKLNSIQADEVLPLHLIQQLTKTKQGRAYIKHKQFVEYANSVINHQNKNLLQVRSVLWSIGFYGSTNEGIKYMTQNGIVKKVIEMSLNCQTLSLRGTCRYILNMFCHSEKGRQILSVNGFHIERKTFACYPLDIHSFFKINASEIEHYCQNKKFWEIYQSKLLPLNKNETLLFDNIKLLINSLSFKIGASQIRQIMKVNSKLAHSQNLLQNVVTLLSTFRYKHQSRKSIMNLFEELIKSPEFNSDIPNKIQYFGSDCI